MKSPYFCKFMKSKRESFGKDFSQRELHKAANVSNSTISRIEDPNDPCLPDPATLGKLARVLHADFHYIMALAGHIKDEPEIRVIQRAATRMSKAEKEKMLGMLSMEFPEAFCMIGSDQETMIDTAPE